MPSIATGKVTMTTISGPWKREIEKTKGTDSISVITCLKAGPGNNVLCFKEFRCFYSAMLQEKKKKEKKRKEKQK